MSARRVYQIDTIAPRGHQRVPVPDGVEQSAAITRARAAVTMWRRRAIDNARTPKEAREIEAREFRIAPSGKAHIRINRVDDGAAQAEKPARAQGAQAEKPARAQGARKKKAEGAPRQGATTRRRRGTAAA